MSLMISHTGNLSGGSVGSGGGASPLGRFMVSNTPLSSSLRNTSPPFYIEEEPPLLSSNTNQWQYLYVLPVLLLEFLAVALTRAVLPSLLLEKYGKEVYLVLGVADCVRGLLAFVACPIFGKLSDIIGRRLCLFVTVLGTCAPVCSLAFFTWEFEGEEEGGGGEWGNSTISYMGGADGISISSTNSNTTAYNSDTSAAAELISRSRVHPHAITSFVILLALSGVFSSTFTLIFAYISDTVRRQDERVSAYGLALATFGLSFTIGPMAGGYLAKTNKQYVFLSSLILTCVDLLYIYFILPESKPPQRPSPNKLRSSSAASSNWSILTMDYEFSWNPMDTVRILAMDPFLRKVGEVAFLYYTGLWAVISTLSLYAVKRFHLTPERLGELMSALGLCTMVAEAVLVRILVPMLGEKRAMLLGLVSFGIQCVVLGFAYEGWHLFVCAAFSMLSNLVYPSLTSLVSGSVAPDSVGEALGAVNGIKALTEGVGPLVFGSLMTLSENSALPGSPYLLAAVLIMAAYKTALELPDVDEDDYIHELERKKRYSSARGNGTTGGVVLRAFMSEDKSAAKGQNDNNDEHEEEYENLLSEIDEDDEDDIYDKNKNDSDDPTSRLPLTFSSLFKGSNKKSSSSSV